MNQFAAMLVDLDGTLIVQDVISPRVAAAVKKVSEIVPVCIATGRRSRDVTEYARLLNLDSPQICDGGATLLNPLKGDIIWNSRLTQERSKEILELLASRGIDFIATHPTGDSFSVSQVRHWDLTRISAKDISEAEADLLAEGFCDAADLNVVKVYLHYNGWWAIDFTAAGIHKGTAAIKLADLIGVAPDRFIAAGDSFNDLPMLEISGYRIAMATAPPELKRIADFVAPPVEEDGLAVAIEEVVLPSLLVSRTV